MKWNSARFCVVLGAVLAVSVLIGGGVASLNDSVWSWFGTSATSLSEDRNGGSAGVSSESDDSAATDTEALRRKIGQMIVVGFVGTEPDDPGVVALRRQLERGLVGGAILLSRNIASPGQVRELNASIRGAAGVSPPLISVDQEGGAVQRLTRENGHRTYPSASQIAAGPADAAGARALAVYAQMAEELSAAGFNVNYGPVADVNSNRSNPIVGRLGRSYSDDPDEVVDYARRFALAHRNAGILTAAKHFPGHGSSRTDSHVAFTDISNTWDVSELIPFKSLAEGGFVDMTMMGHLYHPKFSDGGRLPASLSKKAIAYLRDEIGFEGVVVSDDMEMGALRENFSFEERIVRAVAAGTDLLIFSNFGNPTPDIGPRVHMVIVDAVRAGTIPVARIEEAYGRITRMKGALAARRTADIR